MARYRALPVELEAVQWRGDNFGEVSAFAGTAVSAPLTGNVLAVHTTEGDTYAAVNYYVVRDSRGGYYPCAPEVFEAKYELIE